MSALWAEMREEVRKRNADSGELTHLHMRSRPTGKSLRHARQYLSLVVSDRQARGLVRGLAGGKVRERRVEDIFRAARRAPVPASDAQVQRQHRRALRGKRLPIPLVVTLPDGRDDVAGGEHLLSALYHVNPEMKLPVVHAGGESTNSKGAVMAGKKKRKARTMDMAVPGGGRYLIKRDRAEVKLEESMRDMVDLAKRDLDAPTRERVRKANRDLQLEYLHRVNPHAASLWEASERELGAPSSSDGGELRQLRKAAETIRKSEPGLSEYEARAKALEADPRLAAALSGR